MLGYYDGHYPEPTLSLEEIEEKIKEEEERTATLESWEPDGK